MNNYGKLLKSLDRILNIIKVIKKIKIKRMIQIQRKNNLNKLLLIKPKAIKIIKNKVKKMKIKGTVRQIQDFSL